MNYRIINADVIDGLRQLPDGSVHLCATSPPYWGLRSYLDADADDKTCELGCEKTPEAYVANLVAVGRELRRVLHPSGVWMLNLGDSYNGSGGAGGDYNKGGLKAGQPRYKGRDIKTTQYQLRQDLTPEQLAYVLSELSKARAISDATQDGLE